MPPGHGPVTGIPFGCLSLLCLYPGTRHSLPFLLVAVFCRLILRHGPALVHGVLPYLRFLDALSENGPGRREDFLFVKVSTALGNRASCHPWCRMDHTSGGGFYPIDG